MQCGTIDEMLAVVPCQSRLHQALCILQELNPESLQKGRNDIRGDDIYINRMDYRTDLPENKLWEAHQIYYDIHFVLDGEERVQVAPRAAMIGRDVYNEEGDYQLFDGAAQEEIILQKGMVLIFDKDDVHKVGVISETSEDIKKAVMKVRI